MKVRALRGVCIGVDRHLAAGDTADLDAAQVQFLAGIGAVEPVLEAPEPAEPPAPSGAAAAGQASPLPPAPDLTPDKKSGKKEK